MLSKYTYFKLHDPAAHKCNSSLEYRRDLVERQITHYKNNINILNMCVCVIVRQLIIFNFMTWKSEKQLYYKLRLDYAIALSIENIVCIYIYIYI